MISRGDTYFPFGAGIGSEIILVQEPKQVHRFCSIEFGDRDGYSTP